MKLRLFSLIMCLATTLTFAQKPSHHGDGHKMSKERKEKIEAMKVAFITKELNLSSEEAQVFWPVYNAHQEKMDALKKAHREKMKAWKEKEELSDKDREEMIAEHFKYEEEKLAMEKAYYEELKKVISLEKIVLLHETERKFHRKLIEKMKGERPDHPEQPHPPHGKPE